LKIGAPSIEEIRKLPVFFIIGRERSGTTLLRTLFDAHRNVNIQIEFHFILLFYFKYGKVVNWQRSRLREFYNNLRRLPQFNLITIDEKKLKEDIMRCEGSCTFGELCRVVLYNYVSFFPKEEIILLGDKCPYYSLYCEMLLEVFPEAKFIHLVRDPRDNILSMLKVHFESRFFSSLAYRWKYYNKKIEESKSKHPGSFFTIKYEDLVNAPEAHLQEICGFLEVPYDVEMPEFYNKKDELMKVYPAEVFTKIHKSLFRKINGQHVSEWKKKITKAQLKKADLIAGKFAERYGYEQKYKKRNLLLLLRTLPGRIYGRLYYTYSWLIDIMPFNVKLKIIFLSGRIFKSGWTRFKKIEDRK